MAIIYRLETKGGAGVFHSGSAYTADMKAQGGRHDSPGSRPAPDEEGIGISSYEVCGFVSIQQYKKWFNGKKIRKALHEIGVKLCVYEVPDHCVRAAEWQCVFIKNRAKLVRMRSCAI